MIRVSVVSYAANFCFQPCRAKGEVSEIQAIPTHRKATWAPELDPATLDLFSERRTGIQLSQMGLSENSVPHLPNGFADHYPY